MSAASRDVAYGSTLEDALRNLADQTDADALRQKAQALRAKEEGQAKDITFLLSGHGHLDLTAYDDYFAGKLHDYEYPEEAIATSMKGLPKV